MKIIIIFLLLLGGGFKGKALGPDENITDRISSDLKRALFESKVISDTAKIMGSEVCGIKELDLRYYRFPPVSFEGLACFPSLESLKLRGSFYGRNDSISIDLSGNAALKSFICEGIDLCRLDVRKCERLEELQCRNAGLDTLDVSRNLCLRKLAYGRISDGHWKSERLKCLILPAVPCRLEELICGNVQIGELDLKNCPLLKTVKCISGNLSFLRVESCTLLDTLICPYGILDHLEVGNCSRLTYLNCSNNRIRKLDLSRNIRLTTVIANKQESRYLLNEDGRTGKLERIILPDNTSAPDGIRFLACQDNAIGELEVGCLPYLQYLDCSWNKLKTLDTGKNPELIGLDCAFNFISSLDLSLNLKLQTLDCGGQGYHWIMQSGQDYRLLKKLVLPRQKRVQKGRRLQKLSFQDSDLSTPLKFCHYPELRDLDCSGCDLEKLRLRHNSELRSLDCHGNPLVNLNLRANRKLSSLNIRSVSLRKLDLKRNTQMRSIKCEYREKKELLLILPECIDLEEINFDTGTYEEKLLKKKGSEWIHLPPDYIIIQQK